MQTVLLVEDDDLEEELFRRAWKALGFDARLLVVRSSSDAVAAIHSVKAGDNLRLAIIDVKLGSTSGQSVVRELRENAETRLVPAVVFSSSDERRDIDLAWQHRANGYVCKPIDYHEYLQAVKDTLRFWLGLNCVPTALPVCPESPRPM